REIERLEIGLFGQDEPAPRWRLLSDVPRVYVALFLSLIPASALSLPDEGALFPVRLVAYLWVVLVGVILWHKGKARVARPFAWAWSISVAAWVAAFPALF
ncbi:MAG: hypothetical protein PVF19_12905, partial [Gemmatimonadota bacterium]